MIVWHLLFHLITGFPAYEWLMIMIVAGMLWFLTREHGRKARAEAGSGKPEPCARRKP